MTFKEKFPELNDIQIKILKREILDRIPNEYADADKFELEPYLMSKHAEERSYNRAIRQARESVEEYFEGEV